MIQAVRSGLAAAALLPGVSPASHGPDVSCRSAAKPDAPPLSLQVTAVVLRRMYAHRQTEMAAGKRRINKQRCAYAPGRRPSGALATGLRARASVVAVGPARPSVRSHLETTAVRVQTASRQSPTGNVGAEWAARSEPGQTSARSHERKPTGARIPGRRSDACAAPNPPTGGTSAALRPREAGETGQRRACPSPRPPRSEFQNQGRNPALHRRKLGSVKTMK